MRRSFLDRIKLSATQRIRGAFFGLWLCRPVTRLIDRGKQGIPLGKHGELAAERYLLKQGYWIIERSFGEKVGEIDLIVSDGTSVIFVEVKSRTSDIAGDPTEAVDAEKQRHISQTARLFAVKNQVENSPLRFDVISILWPDRRQAPQIKHIVNAFEAHGNYQMF